MQNVEGMGKVSGLREQTDDDLMAVSAAECDPYASFPHKAVYEEVIYSVADRRLQLGSGPTEAENRPHFVDEFRASEPMSIAQHKKDRFTIFFWRDALCWDSCTGA